MKAVLFLLIIVGVVSFLAAWGYKEYEFSRLEPIRMECSLLSISYSPSTERTRVAPVFGSSKGTSFAVYTTGEPEESLTIWDCGYLGRLTTTNKDVYRYAQDRSILFIRDSYYDTRIIGIEK
jgi:hypothetical protein